MNKFEIFNETKEKIDELKELKPFLEYAIEHEKLTDIEFNVIVVDDEKIQAINKDYRQIDRVTDVISFALEDESFIDIGYRILGDIYISLDQAKRQALEYQHSFKRELFFLTIHGFLHLLGYDHMVIEDEKIMFKKQEEILNGYGITK